MLQHPYSIALFVILGVGVASWLLSVIKNDVSFVDSLWSLFFLVAAVVFALAAEPLSMSFSITFTQPASGLSFTQAAPRHPFQRLL